MKSKDYSGRRHTLSTAVKGGYAVAGFVAMQQTNDSAAPFVQEANFYYLTGIDEPGWLLIVRAEESILVAPDVSEVHRIFDGCLSDEEALLRSGVDRVLSKKDGDALLEGVLRDSDTLGVIGPDPHEEYNSFSSNPAPKQLYERVKASNCSVTDIRLEIAKMRSRKSEAEINAIRHAANATCDAFQQVKKALSSMTYEYNLEAEFTYVFRNQGLTHAYEPIIAGGVNACTLHYSKNSENLPENGLVLIDVGARFNGYAADVTRTYVVGTPSEREVAVHAAVEKAHVAIIDLIKPGLSVKIYHEKVDEIMKTALEGLGLLSSPDDYRKYFPHAVSHGLGLDVHDSLGGPEHFQPGMVLTVEPGIYIPEEGIGVRIEDDILVTETGNENLTSSLSTSL